MSTYFKALAEARKAGATSFEFTTKEGPRTYRLKKGSKVIYQCVENCAEKKEKKKKKKQRRTSKKKKKKKSKKSSECMAHQYRKKITDKNGVVKYVCVKRKTKAPKYAEGLAAFGLGGGRKVRVGPRGGKYILRGGKKVYV
mgnify:CR=1 FL=1